MTEQGHWVLKAAQIYVNKCGWKVEDAIQYANELCHGTNGDDGYMAEGYTPEEAVAEDMTYWEA